MIEYAVIISVLAGASLTDLISIDPTWNVFLVSGFLWVDLHSNIKKSHIMMRVGCEILNEKPIIQLYQLYQVLYNFVVFIENEAIDLFERLRKLGNLVALTFIVIAQFVTQGVVLFFTFGYPYFLEAETLSRTGRIESPE